ncbi:MAG: ferrous iron transport protein A [Planctomycetales bacterium]|nr:ferrous iron transport protein A [Planctomycetales bacterium]MCA9170854.1 ferrous iron transport protein A [Planctomycetales bacterium]
MLNIIPLSLLAVGQIAEVFNVVGITDHSRRLGEMGFREGARVEMVRPGATCIVRVDNCKLCFRDCDVSCVLVRTGHSA